MNSTKRNNFAATGWVLLEGRALDWCDQTADAYLVSSPPPCYHSGTYKTQVVLPGWISEAFPFSFSNISYVLTDLAHVF